jgi:hypothetical protein
LARATADTLGAVLASANRANLSADGATSRADVFSSAGQILAHAALYAVTVAVILLPAAWNGFPLVFSDTGGYLIRPFVHDLELGRSALYGAFLAAGIAADFWPNVAIQALLCTWTVRLVLRTQGITSLVLWIAAIAALCAGTSLPWFAGQLEPDVFMPLSVFAFYLIALAAPQLRGWEVAALIAVIAFSVAAHMSIFAVLLLLFAFCAMLRVAVELLAIALPRPRLAGTASSLLLGTMLLLGSNYAIAGVATFTPGGSIFLLGRLLQDGYVKTYLDKKCPDSTLSLCNYRDALPDNSGDWLWDTNNTPLAKLGGWRVFSPEADRIVRDIILQQPGALIVTALKETFQQLATVATGEGLNARNTWHTQWVLQTYAPATVQHFDASAQQNNAFDFHFINALHIPLALGSTLALPILILLCWRRHPGTATLTLTLLAALVANAAVCATFSVVDDRYQSRIVPISVLGAGIACYQLFRSHQRHNRSRMSNDAAAKY